MYSALEPIAPHAGADSLGVRTGNTRPARAGRSERPPRAQKKARHVAMPGLVSAPLRIS
jgi:hypothetical protein